MSSGPLDHVVTVNEARVAGIEPTKTVRVEY